MIEKIGMISEDSRRELLSKIDVWQEGNDPHYKVCPLVPPVSFIKLEPKGFVPRHTDNGEKRLTVLQTNEHCYNWVGDESVHLQLCGVYEFDGRLPHGASNDGLSDRIHLVEELM